MQPQSTIVARSTPPGVGATGVIRLSGPEAIAIAGRLFEGRSLATQSSHTIHFGRIVMPVQAGDSGASDVVDEVVVSLFRTPHSYTGEDVVEISCHGSPYILQRVLELCVAGGAAPAAAGEFTYRAFLNGKMDLTQAEAVADLIAAESRAQQQTAMQQLRGGFSQALNAMRQELIQFSALIELELDFSGEDVVFADREQLSQLLERLNDSTIQLISSFRLGNALKNGVRVAIVGAPNAGKSTLLNALLNEERAIVSEIAGTTRDTIEEVLNIDGMLFRFIDTAGIRNNTADTIEQQGIARSLSNAASADIVIHLVDMSAPNDDSIGDWLAPFSAKTITVGNKMDCWNDRLHAKGIDVDPGEGIYITAKSGEGLEDLRTALLRRVNAHAIAPGDTIITNTRHLAALQKISAAIADIKAGLEGDIPGDLIALDIRQALHYIGELTGQVLHDRDVLGAIFGKFCIGK